MNCDLYQKHKPNVLKVQLIVLIVEDVVISLIHEKHLNMLINIYILFVIGTLSLSHSYMVNDHSDS